MVDVRVSAASGTSDDWAASTLVLGVGQFAWETDTQILRVGDGNNLEPDLPIVAQPTAPLLIQDTDTDVSSDVVWSAFYTQGQIESALSSANDYTNKALRGFQTGTAPRFDVCFQNADGTYPNRPLAYCVFVFTTGGSTVAPSWMTPGVDVLFYRS